VSPHCAAQSALYAGLAASRPVVARNIGLVVCLGLCFFVSGNAQNLPSSDSGAVPLTLHYDDPVTFPVGTAQSIVFGDFKCDPDGSVYVPLGDASPSTMTIVALTPSGGVVRFSPRAVDGYRNVISLVRYYVSPSYVYLVAMGDKIDPERSQNVIGRSRFIQVFKHNGDFVQTLVLEPDVNPVNLAAFPSGDIVLFDVDKLNHTTRLHLLDSAGRSESELGLFDNDFVTKLDAPGKNQSGSSAYDDKQKLLILLSTANVISHGDNLLLTASQANLPALELNQHGVVRAMSLALPAGMVLSALLPSSDALLHAVVGHLRSFPFSGTTLASKDTSDEPRGFFPTEIDEFYPQDGSLARRIAVEPGPMPVCAINGSYTFLVPRGQDGKLQVIHATPVSK
jgi:hypothetical protein